MIKWPLGILLSLTDTSLKGCPLTAKPPPHKVWTSATDAPNEKKVGYFAASMAG